MRSVATEDRGPIDGMGYDQQARLCRGICGRSDMKCDLCKRQIVAGRPVYHRLIASWRGFGFLCVRTGVNLLKDGSLRAHGAGAHAQSSAIVQSARARSILLAATNAEEPCTTPNIAPNCSEHMQGLFIFNRFPLNSCRARYPDAKKEPRRMRSISLLLAMLIALSVPVVSIVSATDAVATRGGTHQQSPM
jgi:hypothetical protein